MAKLPKTYSNSFHLLDFNEKSNGMSDFSQAALMKGENENE